VLDDSVVALLVLELLVTEALVLFLVWLKKEVDLESSNLIAGVGRSLIVVSRYLRSMLMFI